MRKTAQKAFVSLVDVRRVQQQLETLVVAGPSDTPHSDTEISEISDKEVDEAVEECLEIS